MHSHNVVWVFSHYNSQECTVVLFALVHNKAIGFEILYGIEFNKSKIEMKLFISNNEWIQKAKILPRWWQETCCPYIDCLNDDVIKRKYFPRYWRGIHRWHGALMFSLIGARINGWVNNDEAGDLRRHRAHYDVPVMLCRLCISSGDKFPSLLEYIGINTYRFKKKG